MTPEKENFDALCRLLRVKRFERPPPDYFNDFSRQIIAQIRRGDIRGRQRLFDRISWEAPWLQRLIEAFQAKPAFAVSFGAAVCALLVSAVIYSERWENNVATVENVAKAPQAPIVPASFALGGPSAGTLAVIGTNTSLSPIIESSGSLFDQLRPEAPVPAAVPPEWQWRGNGE